jgi:cytochrome c-type biogenesis protein
MAYLLTFAEGMMAFISPCHLPMLPVFISYFTGQNHENRRQKTLTNAIGFVSGFSLLFVVLGAFAGRIGGLLAAHQAIVNVVCGGIVILFGLNFLEVVRLPFAGADRRLNVRHINMGFFPSVILGIVFSISLTPCTGAFLGSALMLAAQSGSGEKGILMLFGFSMGLGLPFVACALLIDRLKNAFDFIKRNRRAINIASGALLILLGVMMALGWIGYLFAWM